MVVHEANTSGMKIRTDLLMQGTIWPTVQHTVLVEHLWQDLVHPYPVAMLVND